MTAVQQVVDYFSASTGVPVGSNVSVTYDGYFYVHSTPALSNASMYYTIVNNVVTQLQTETPVLATQSAPLGAARRRLTGIIDASTVYGVASFLNVSNLQQAINANATDVLFAQLTSALGKQPDSFYLIWTGSGITLVVSYSINSGQAAQLNATISSPRGTAAFTTWLRQNINANIQTVSIKNAVSLPVFNDLTTKTKLSLMSVIVILLQSLLVLLAIAGVGLALLRRSGRQRTTPNTGKRGRNDLWITLF